MYKNGAQDNALLLVSIILLKRIGSEIYEETKKEIEQQNKGFCQDIIVIITIISVLRIEDFEEHNPYDPYDPYDPYNPIQPIGPSTPGPDILETNPNYIPPIRPFYPLR